MKKLTLSLAIIVISQAVTAQPLLSRVEVKTYQLRWNDAGSRHEDDMAIWQPVPPAGYYVLGSVGFNSNGYDPNGKVSTWAFFSLESIDISGKKWPMLAKPVDYKEVWNDKGSGASRDGAVWEPVCPANYISVGHVASAGYNKPSVNDCACLLSVGNFGDGRTMFKKKKIKPNYSWMSSGVGNTLWNKVTYQTYLKSKDGAIIFTFSSGMGNSILRADKMNDENEFGLEGLEISDLETWVYTAIPSSVTRGNPLMGTKLLISSNKHYGLLIEPTGNLVVYNAIKNNEVIWETKTSAKGPLKLTLQNDGNICLKKLDETFVWCSMTTEAQKMVLENTGKLVAYDKNNKAIWSSK